MNGFRGQIQSLLSSMHSKPLAQKLMKPLVFTYASWWRGLGNNLLTYLLTF
jgi:hypothetical protein